MSKALINAVALALPLATVVYWFFVREPIDVEPAPQSMAPLVSKHSKPDTRSCVERTEGEGIEMAVTADCEQVEGTRSGDTLGQIAETRQGKRVVTGYDL